MKDEIAKKILEQTKQNYNTIAVDFNKTRQYVWPGVKDFKKYVKAGDRILDLGCGNGKLRLLFKNVKVDYIGIDNSRQLLNLAETNFNFRIANQKFIFADITDLPFPDSYFDVIFGIATFHHLPSKELRFKALVEVKRVMKKGGVLIMTNWNLWDQKHLHYIIKYAALKIIGKSKLDFKDIYLPWMGGKVRRYYHAFTLEELKKIISRSGLKVEENFLSYLERKQKNSKQKKFHYLNAANIVTIAKKC